VPGTTHGRAVGRAQGENYMVGEYNAISETFISTVLVDHPRLGRVRENSDAYDAQTCCAVVEGPTQPPPTRCMRRRAAEKSDRDEQGRQIADMSFQWIGHEVKIGGRE
jgi:hypothetical protein